MKTQTRQISIVAVVVMLVSITVQAAPDTFSIDAASPSLDDPADLLNIGMFVQVPKAQLGLGANDELDALAGGDDAVQWNNVIYFSVDRNSQGIAGPWTPLDVNGQATRNQQAGDIFVTTDNNGTGAIPQGINFLHTNQNFFGELPLVGSMVDNTGNPQDNLDAFSFEEYDLNGDGITDRPTFFSLAAGSPSLVMTPGFSAADILISPAGSGTFNVFATAAQMGLNIDDDLDAMALLDLNADGVVTPGIDAALFSLAPNSPTLIALGASPADIFYTTFLNASVVRYNAASLGLMEYDNVDALEVQVPEPATLCLLVVGGATLMLKRRKRC